MSSCTTLPAPPDSGVVVRGLALLEKALVESEIGRANAIGFARDMYAENLKLAGELAALRAEVGR